MSWKTKEQRNDWERQYNSRPEVKAKRSARWKSWATKNRAALAEKEADRRLTMRAKTLVSTVSMRAKKRGIAFNLDNHIEEIQARIDAGNCELTGYPFDLLPGRKFNSPSIDRIDSAGGYTFDNIRIVLNLVNAALGDWGEETLRDVVRCWQASDFAKGKRK